jgi:hypothetical protein
MTSRTIPTNDQQAAVAERAVCISVRKGLPGNRKKVATEEVTVDADAEAVAVSKELLDSPEWKAVKNLDNEVRRYLERKCLPSMFREGVHLVPFGLLETVDAQMEAFAARRRELVDAFCEIYPEKVQSAKLRLRGLYRPSDYPTIDRVRRSFKFDWQYVALGVPGQLAEISMSMFAREREKAEAKWAEAQREIQHVLRAAMAELVDHMVERLTPDPKTGKPKVFFASTVEKLAEFLADFKFRNITDDAALAGLVERAKAMLAGTTAEDLRTGEALRGRVAAGMGELKASLDRIVTDRPTRKIRLPKTAAA